MIAKCSEEQKLHFIILNSIGGNDKKVLAEVDVPKIMKNFKESFYVKHHRGSCVVFNLI